MYPASPSTEATLSESTWFLEQPRVVMCTVGVGIGLRLPPDPRDDPTVWAMKDGEAPPDAVTWRLTHIRRGSAELEPVPLDVVVTLSWEDGRIAGSAGCNQYFAEGSFHAPPRMYATTMMMCPEHVMDVERSYLAALTSCARLVRSGSGLEGVTSEGATVLVWSSDSNTD